MGFRDATTPWKIFYVASGLFLLTIIIVAICIAFLLKAPGVAVTGAYVYCLGFNTSQDGSGVCANSALCNNSTTCRDQSMGIDFRVMFIVNNPSISTCTFAAEIDVYDESRSPGTGTFLLATSYFEPNHLANSGALGKTTKGVYVANLKLKEPSNETDPGTLTTYPNSIHLIASTMHRACCSTFNCTVLGPTYPDYVTNSCAVPLQATEIKVRVKGKMHFSCLIQPEVNFEQVLDLNSIAVG